MRSRTVSRPRMLVLVALAASLGVAVAVLPALAAGSPAPSEVKLEINENCHLPEWPCWNVKANNPEDIGQIQPFTIAQGGTISFEDNDSKAPTDVLWKGAAPSCMPEMPSTPKTPWSSNCTFANAGEYEFESQELFNDGTFNYTKYKVIVEKSATTGTTPTTPTTPTTTTPTTTTPTTPMMPGEPSQGPPLEGGSKALKLAGSQHGSSVRGSVKISQAGAGGRLEVGLFATGASLAKTGHSKQVRVGRLVRSSLKAANVSFSVALSAKGKAALRHRRRLALMVKITLTPLNGAAVTLTRGVVVHA
jgi:hypothetical protein